MQLGKPETWEVTRHAPPSPSPSLLMPRISPPKNTESAHFFPSQLLLMPVQHPTLPSRFPEPHNISHTHWEHSPIHSALFKTQI